MPSCSWGEWLIRGASEPLPAKFNLSMDVIMNDIDSLKEQIAKTEAILAESRENHQKNPGAYSARLLLMSTENYLADLLQQLDSLRGSIEGKKNRE
jgi:hypothetical protein